MITGDKERHGFVKIKITPFVTILNPTAHEKALSQALPDVS